MAHRVLALRYRPKRFADIVGNELHVQILRNSIIQDELRTAYFFAGSKGSGKTSTARIFAKSINCTERQEQDPEPCNQCMSCIETDNDVIASDVQEIDAASQNSVQSIRQLIANIQYPPQAGKKRIIILDEVHMLSQAASNALLKTLEEPPDHVVFLFCTTDPQKVVDTVRSRALYFEFQRLRADDIAGRLLQIAKSEGFGLEDEAAHLIGSSVNGAMRDAITILDQASILSKEVTVDVISKITGYVSVGDLYELFELVHSSDDNGSQKWLDKMVNKLDQDIITSTLDFIETLIVLHVGSESDMRIPDDMLERAKRLSAAFTMQQLFSMGEIAKRTLSDHRRLSLRDSRVLLRLMVAGLILAKEDKHDSSRANRTPMHQLLQTGRNIKLDVSVTLKKLFNAEEVILTSEGE